EVQPVTNLVRRGLALVVAARVRGRRPQEGLPVDDDAVEVRLARLGDDVRQVRPAEQTRAGCRRVQVEVPGTTGVQGVLHVVLRQTTRAGVEPGRVVGPRHT